MKLSTAEAKPVKPVLLLNTPIMVALFKEILLDEITKEGGKWNSANPKGHALLFQDIEVRQKKDSEEEGINIPLLKNNYNFNDSNWVNIAANQERLIACAKKANDGKDVSKKDVSAALEHIKNTLKKSAKAAPVTTSKVSAAAQGLAPTPDVDVNAPGAGGQGNSQPEETIGGNASKKAAAQAAKDNKGAAKAA